MKEIIKASDIAPVLFKIKPSKQYGGVGVFALRSIKKGTIVCNIQKIDKDFFVSWLEYNKIDPITQKVIIDFCAQDRDGYYGPLDLNYLPIPTHMNHSCVGNIGFNHAGNFVTIRTVRANEELCFDYALVISRPTYRLKCKCKNKNCRKVITGNDWSEKQFIKKNYKYMSPIQRDLVHKKFKKEIPKNPNI